MTGNLRLRMPSAGLASAVALMGLWAGVGQASFRVVPNDFEPSPLGPIACTISDFSDATYGGASSVANIVSGQALEFALDVKTGMGH